LSLLSVAVMSDTVGVELCPQAFLFADKLVYVFGLMFLLLDADQ